MSFLVSPPEINSAQMHAGAGSEPMLAAAVAWDGLAGELGLAAGSFSSVTSGLASQAWQGPASIAMTAAAAPYARWLNVAATQAGGVAVQVKAVVAAYEAARAAVVHPLVVAANRNQMVSLVVSNLLGLNAPAIAAKEAEYEQMWAQDVTAMVGYHGGASAAAAQLTPWQQALQTLPGQVAAAAGANPAATSIEYGLVASLIGTAIITSVKGMGSQLGTTFTTVATTMSTGTAAVGKAAARAAGDMAKAAAPAAKALKSTPAGAAVAATAKEMRSAVGGAATAAGAAATRAVTTVERAVAGAGAAVGQAADGVVAQGIVALAGNPTAFVDAIGTVAGNPTVLNDVVTALAGNPAVLNNLVTTVAGNPTLLTDSLTLLENPAVFNDVSTLLLNDPALVNDLVNLAQSNPALVQELTAVFNQLPPGLQEQLEQLGAQLATQDGIAPPSDLKPRPGA